MPLKLKTTEIEGKKYAMIDDKGHPVYVDDDGKEQGLDAAHSATTIARLNAEAQKNREDLETAKATLTKYDGIDSEKARKALETVAALDSKDLVQAGKVEEIKAAAVKAVEESMRDAIAAKEAEIEKISGERDGLRTSLHDELIGGNFARSPFIQEKLTLPPDIAQQFFGRNFKVEDGSVVAYREGGKEKIYSKARPGELASFEEALEILVDGYGARDSILKGRQQRGGGSPGEGKGDGSGRQMSRAEFDGMDSASKRKAMADGVKVVDAA